MPAPLTQSDRIATYAASAASALDDDLTVAMSVLKLAQMGKASKDDMAAATSALNRASYRNAMVLQHMFRNGARRTPASPEALIETCRTGA